jgi:hypothetical protein
MSYDKPIVPKEFCHIFNRLRILEHYSEQNVAWPIIKQLEKKKRRRT